VTSRQGALKTVGFWVYMVRLRGQKVSWPFEVEAHSDRQRSHSQLVGLKFELQNPCSFLPLTAFCNNNYNKNVSRIYLSFNIRNTFGHNFAYKRAYKKRHKDTLFFMEHKKYDCLFSKLSTVDLINTKSNGNHCTIKSDRNSLQGVISGSHSRIGLSAAGLDGFISNVRFIRSYILGFNAHSNYDNVVKEDEEVNDAEKQNGVGS
jgi:hypothetical protein